MIWSPLSPREWDALVKDTSDGVGYCLTDDQIKRIKATINNGWSPDEPSWEVLNRWGARDVLGWHLVSDGKYWQGEDGTWRCGGSRWRPASNLAQALQVVMETDIDVDVCLNTHHELGRDVKSAFVTVDAIFVHEGAFDEEAIARKIMVELWRRLERGET